LKPVSSLLLSIHKRLICVCETAIAVNPPGAAGIVTVHAKVVAVAAAGAAEQQVQRARAVSRSAATDG